MFCAERNHALCSGCPHERPFDRIFIGFHSARCNQRRVASLTLSGPFRNSLSVPRFHIPLVEPDVRISRIRLSDERRLRHTPHYVQVHLKAKLVPGSPGLSLEVIGLRHSPIRCSLPKRVRSQAPFLRYPAGTTSDPKRRPVPHGFPVGLTTTAGASRVASDLPLYTCVATPAGPLGARVAVFFQRRRPSPANHRVGSRIAVFEACSAFTARYGLHTRGVALRPFTPEASEISLPTSPLRLLPTEATLVGWDFHPLKIRAFSRRT